MKNKKIFNTLLTLCAALILMGGFSVTAYAQTPAGQDDATDDSGVVYEEAAYHRDDQKRQLLLYPH